MHERLSGLELEYGILQIYCRDRGKREAKLIFSIGQGSQDWGFAAKRTSCLPRNPPPR